METSYNSGARRPIIAVDGYSSCGKSTFAKAIAAKRGYIFIDTGAMYRAVALMSLRAGLVSQSGEVESAGVERLVSGELPIRFVFNPDRGASDLYLGDECVEGEIRTMAVSSLVSRVAAIAAVRSRLVALQQEMGRSGGVVMDGRDIGTVVFPDAEIKLFMTADVDVRAMRRYRELQGKGDTTTTLDEIRENVAQRDKMDEEREVSPLRRADDALLLDNSAMGVDEQMEWFDGVFNSKFGEL